MKSRLRPIAIMALSLAILALLSLAAFAGGVLTVNVLDVGEGDSILLRGPDGFTVLVDGGPSLHCPTSYLIEQAVTHLDVVVLTHPHADHVGCLAEVLSYVPADVVVHNGEASSSAAYSAFATVVAVQAIPTAIVHEGQTLAWGCCVSATVLNPVNLDGTTNDNSVVLRVNFGSSHILLTGDISSEAESRILTRTLDLSSQLLKVAHHGSGSSSSLEFLTATHPIYAAISVGEGNPYGHPAQETLDRLESAGAYVYRTDLRGTLTFLADGDTVRQAVDLPHAVFLPIVVGEAAQATATPTKTPTRLPIRNIHVYLPIILSPWLSPAP